MSANNERLVETRDSGRRNAAATTGVVIPYNQEGDWPDMANIAERHFHRCLDKAGLHHRRLYDLRHTFASLLLTPAHRSSTSVSKWGIKNIQLTVKLYGHLEPRANRHWLKKLPGAKKSQPASVATSGNQAPKMKKTVNDDGQMIHFKAGHGIRTRDFDLGKVALYH
jgi:hypothetical protein